MSAGSELTKATAQARAMREKREAQEEKALAVAVRQVLEDGTTVRVAAKAWGVPFEALRKRVAAAKKAREAQRVIQMSALACPRCGVEDICFDGKPAGMPCACVKRAAKKTRGG